MRALINAETESLMMSSSRGVSLVSALEGLKKDGEIEKIAKKGMKKSQKTRN